MDTDDPDLGEPKRLPILPLRDVVVYPHIVIPLFVGREKSVVALDQAMSAGKEIFLVPQTKADVDDPAEADIYEIGTVATILQLLKLPDGTVKVFSKVAGGHESGIWRLVSASPPSSRNYPRRKISTSVRWRYWRDPSCLGLSSTSS